MPGYPANRMEADKKPVEKALVETRALIKLTA
jgi:hypothetical protein